MQRFKGFRSVVLALFIRELKTRFGESQKIKQLAVIQSPITPETAEYRKRIYNLITILIGLFLLIGIIRLVKVTIEDHKY